MNGCERKRRDSAEIDGDQWVIPVGLEVCVRSENGSECEFVTAAVGACGSS